MEAQSVLAAAGSDSQSIAGLWWVFLAITSVVYVLVIGALWLAIHRARRRAAVTAAEEPLTDARSRTIVGVAIAATVLVLLGMLTADFVVGRAARRAAARGRTRAHPHHGAAVLVAG
jgi:heme/copper-type cytochrome/quinol oxidase subunit 2